MDFFSGLISLLKKLSQSLCEPRFNQYYISHQSLHLLTNTISKWYKRIFSIYDDFLSDRKPVVQVGESISKPFDQEVGCVQGSPSGPPLFSMLVNNVAEALNLGKIVCYADDSYLIYEGDSWGEVCKTVGAETTNMVDWLQDISMVVNMWQSCGGTGWASQSSDQLRRKILNALNPSKSGKNLGNQAYGIQKLWLFAMYKATPSHTWDYNWLSTWSLACITLVSLINWLEFDAANSPGFEPQSLTGIWCEAGTMSTELTLRFKKVSYIRRFWGKEEIVTLEVDKVRCVCHIAKDHNSRTLFFLQNSHVCLNFYA